MKGSICGCEIIDERTKYIKNGYVLTIDDGDDINLVIKHVVTSPGNEGYVTRKEKTTLSFPFFDQTVYEREIFKSVDDLIKYAKKRLERKCKHHKDLLVGESVLSLFEVME